MAKAHTLPLSTQERIARAYITAKEAKKKVSYNVIAARFRCTPAQVRSYVAAFEAGRYSGKQGRRRAKEERATDDDTDSVTIIDGAIRAALRDLQKEELKPSEVIGISQKAVRTLRDLMTIKIERHLRGVDAEFVPFLIRHFLPAASDEDVVKIIEEVKVAWKDYRD